MKDIQYETDEVIGELGGTCFFTRGGRVIEGNYRIGDAVATVFDNRSKRWLPGFKKEVGEAHPAAYVEPPLKRGELYQSFPVSAVYKLTDNKIWFDTVYPETKFDKKYYIDLAVVCPSPSAVMGFALLEQDADFGLIILKYGTKFRVIKFQLLDKNVNGTTIGEYYEYRYQYEYQDKNGYVKWDVGGTFTPPNLTFNMGHPLNDDPRGHIDISHDAGSDGDCTWGAAGPSQINIPRNFSSWSEQIEGSGTHDSVPFTYYKKYARSDSLAQYKPFYGGAGYPYWEEVPHDPLISVRCITLWSPKGAHPKTLAEVSFEFVGVFEIMYEAILTYSDTNKLWGFPHPALNYDTSRSGQYRLYHHYEYGIKCRDFAVYQFWTIWPYASAFMEWDFHGPSWIDLPRPNWSVPTGGGDMVVEVKPSWNWLPQPPDNEEYPYYDDPLPNAWLIHSGVLVNEYNTHSDRGADIWGFLANDHRSFMNYAVMWGFQYTHKKYVKWWDTGVTDVIPNDAYWLPPGFDWIEKRRVGRFQGGGRTSRIVCALYGWASYPEGHELYPGVSICWCIYRMTPPGVLGDNHYLYETYVEGGYFNKELLAAMDLLSLGDYPTLQEIAIQYGYQRQVEGGFLYNDEFAKTGMLSYWNDWGRSGGATQITLVGFATRRF